MYKQTFEEFERNNFLKQFLSASFSPKEFIGEQLKNYKRANFHLPLEEIRKGLKILDNKVKGEIKNHHKSMVGNMLKTLELSKEVNSISGEVNRVCRSGNQIKNSYKEKYDRMNQRCCQFKNIIQTCEKLRLLNRYLQLYKNIHAKSHLDLPIVSRNLIELEDLLEKHIPEEDKRNIRAYVTTHPNIKTIRDEILQESDRLFLTAITQHPKKSIVEFEISLEVFFIFGLLHKKVKTFLLKVQNAILKKLSEVQMKYNSLQTLFSGLGEFFHILISSIQDICYLFDILSKKNDSIIKSKKKAGILSYYDYIVEMDPKITPSEFFRSIFLPTKSSSSSKKSKGNKNGQLLSHFRQHCEFNHGLFVKNFPRIHEFLCRFLLLPICQIQNPIVPESTSKRETEFFKSKDHPLFLGKGENFELISVWIDIGLREQFYNLFENSVFSPFHSLFVQKMIYQRFRMELEQALFLNPNSSNDPTSTYMGGQNTFIPKHCEHFDAIRSVPSEKRIRKFLKNLFSEVKKYHAQSSSNSSNKISTPITPKFTPFEEKSRNTTSKFVNSPLSYSEPISGNKIYLEILEKVRVILSSLIDTYSSFFIKKKNYIYFLKEEEELFFENNINKKNSKNNENSILNKKRNLIMFKPNAYVLFQARLFQHLEILYLYLDDFLDLLNAPNFEYLEFQQSQFHKSVNSPVISSGLMSEDKNLQSVISMSQRFQFIFEDFEKKMKSVKNLMNECLNPSFEIFQKQVSKIFFSIQFERYDEEEEEGSKGMIQKKNNQKVNWYVLELEKNLLSFSRNYLQYFGSGKHLRKILKRKAEKLVLEYLNSVSSSISHPLSKKGQMVLLRELTQVDLSICNCFYYIKNLLIYRDYTEFKGLLFLFDDSEDDYSCYEKIKKIAKVFQSKFILVQFLLNHFMFVLGKQESNKSKNINNSISIKKSETFYKVLMNFKNFKEYQEFLESMKFDYFQISKLIIEKLENHIQLRKIEFTKEYEKEKEIKEEEETVGENKNKENNNNMEGKEVLEYLSNHEKKEYEIILLILKSFENVSNN